MKNKALIFLLALVTVALLLQITCSTAESGQATLTWTAPTTYTDGTPIPAIGGYKVHIGQSSCNYLQHVDVGNTTTYATTDLPDGGTYYFAVTAYDSSGSESAYSNEVVKSIPTATTYLIAATYGKGGAIAAVENGNVTIKTMPNSTTVNVTVNDGASQTFAITAESGYVIGDVTADGVSLGPVTSYTFPGVIANHTITATFVSKSFTITATAGVGGTITPSGVTTVQAGGTQTYKIAAAKDYRIADVKVDGVSIGAVSYYTFNNVRSNHTIEATFATTLSYTITASAGTGGSVSPSGAVTVIAGASQVFAITASDGYTVADVKVDGASVGPVTSYTFTNVDADHTITATFSGMNYTVTASAGAGGAITPSGVVAVPAGGSQTFSIDPGTGFGIADVKVDGTSVGAVSTYTFTNVAANHTIEASFSAVTFTIAASAGTGGAVTPSGAVTVPYGASQSFTIAASDGFSITEVKIDGVSAGPITSYTFSNVTANHTIEASFGAITYTISASAGTGGSITPSGAVTVPAGTTQAFTIAASAGYRIADVKVDGVSVGVVASFTFPNVNTNHTIEASFGVITYSITASAGTGGTISPSGTVSVPAGTDQSYTITPSAGYGIATVRVDGVSIGAPATYTFSNLTGDHTIEATFQAVSYAIAASAGSGGSITPAGTVTVPAGGNETFTVAPSPGYSITDVLVDGASVGPVSTYTFTGVSANHTIQASFGGVDFTITSSAGTGGTITPSGTVTVPAGGSQTYTISAAGGYRIADVKVDGASVGAVSTYTFSNVTANRTIEASFSVISYTITATAGTGGSIAPAGVATVASGGSQSYTITAAAGYRIADVKLDGVSAGPLATYTFTNVTSNHSIDASFSPITYTITATAGTGGTIAPTGIATVSWGGSQTYSIAASAGYSVADVKVDGASVGAVSTYTFNNVTADHTIAASFSVITYTITATAGTGGTIAPSGATTIVSGGSQTYTVTASAGFHIADVRVDGTSVGAVATYTFSNVTANRTIEASFSAVAIADLGINSGGPQYTNTEGFIYRADQYFSGGSVRTTTAAISGTTEGPLYQSWRYGSSFSYAIPLANGSYNVTFKFAETEYSAPRKRVFSVKIGGTTVITNLDIFAKVGRNTAYDVVIPASVTTGTLNISFVKKNSSATVSGLKISAAVGQAAVSAAPSALTATPQQAAADVLAETSYTLPGDRSVNWAGNVGVTGDIPARTATCATVAPSGADDTQAIRQAIASCPAGQVVALATGTFYITSPIAVKSEVTLRGAGMGATILRGAAGMNGPYLIGFDAGPYYDRSFSLQSDLAKGSTSITTGTAHGWSAGDIIVIDQLNSNTADPVITNVGTSGTCTWCGRGNGARSLGQLNRILAVPTPTTATLEWPLVWNYSSSLTPQATRIGGITANAGVEDLTIDNGASGSMNQSDDGGTIAFYGAANSWLLRVEAKGSYRTMVRIKRGYRNTIRSCTFHEGVPSLPPAGLSYDTSRAYGVWVGPGSGNLLENNKLYHLFMPFKLDSTTTGNVISYNYVTDLYYTNANWNLGTVQFHGGHPAMNLVEGNHGEGRVLADNIWGSSSHNTLFRNRAALAPKKTGAPWDFDLQKNATYYNIVGNVIGTGGVESVYQFYNAALTAQASIYRLGYVSDGDKDASGNDPQVAATLLLEGNWDSVNNSTVWNGGAGPLPATMYLSGKPPWWGSMQWPAVGPDLSPMYPAGPGICNGMPWDDASIPSSSVPSRPASPSVQ